MKKIFAALSGSMVAVGFATIAFAQSVPNIGNYQGKADNYRVGVQVTTVTTVSEQSFEQPTIEDLQDYLNPTLIAGYPGAGYTPTSQVAEVFDIRGATVVGGYGTASNTLAFRVVDPASGTTLLNSAGQPCTFSFTGTSRQASFNQFDLALDDDASPTSQLLSSCLATAWSQFSPVDPVVGNPYSLQGNMVRAGLDLTDSDSIVEQDALAREAGGEGPNSAGDPWVIGATFSTGSSDRFHMNRIDARLSKGWRVFEGNRARLKLDIPFSYTRIKGTSAYTTQVGLGLEVPVRPNWSLEPRVAYGLVYSPDNASIGHILQASVASRLVIGNLGRGHLVLGNMAGYSFTLKPPGDSNLNPDVKNWVFRNGLAYEMPLKMRMAGRSTSFRASYVFTNYTGDRLYNNKFHEMTVSFGLRGRDNSPRALRDVVRLNFNTIQARGFSTYTVGLGFRF